MEGITPSTRVAVQHLRYLDSIRGLSALYVAACHAYLMYAPGFLAEHDPASASGGLLLATSWLRFGRSAVTVFIVLSGYCLMLPVVNSAGWEMRSTYWQFIARRARRIVPPYYAAVALSLVLVAMVPDLKHPSIGEWHKSFAATGAAPILTHLLLVHNYVPTHQYAIAHPFWSVATEWQIYFLFPLLAWAGRRFGNLRIVTVSFAITVALDVFLLVFWPRHNPWPPVFVALFGVGMASAGRNFPRGGSSPAIDGRRWAIAAVVLLVLGTISNLAVGENRQEIPDILVGGGIGAAMVFLTSAVSSPDRPLVLRVLEAPALVGLGRFSYSLYLIHAPVLALFYLLARSWGLAALELQIFILLVAVPATVVVSYLFFLAFERPFLARG